MSCFWSNLPIRRDFRVSISRLMELHELARKAAASYPHRRFLYEELRPPTGRNFTGIVGPRGSPKTVMLRQYARSHEDACYLSADTFEPDEDPWDILRSLQQHYGFRTFLLDEVHFLPEATALLKRLYDFLDAQVIFSSSVALAMRASAHDLSRRVRLLELHNFSFREYVYFKQGGAPPRFGLQDLAEGKWTPEHLRAGAHFEDYLFRAGILPFALEEPEPLPFLRNILDKVIAQDIPRVARLALDELDAIRKMLRFVGRSGVDGINYSSLSRNIGITKYKAGQYVDCLESTFILHRFLPLGTNVLREPKILMAPPCRLLYRDRDDAVGGLREDFAVAMLRQAGVEFGYLKSTRGKKTPDYLIAGRPDKLVVEIGGGRKGREQFKGVKAGRKLVFAHTDTPAGGRIPLFLLGFLS